MATSPGNGTLSHSQSSLRRSGRFAQNDAQPGSLWLSVSHGEEPWPVVICDEDTLAGLSRKTKINRPANARRPDGTWPGHVGALDEPKIYPTMRLGISKLSWTPSTCLQPFDIRGAEIVERSLVGPLKDAYEDSYLGRKIHETRAPASHLPNVRELTSSSIEAQKIYSRIGPCYKKDEFFAKKLHLHHRLFHVDLIKTKEDAVPIVKIKTEGETSISPLKRKVSALGFVYPPNIELPPELDCGVEEEREEYCVGNGDNSNGREVEDESPKRYKSNGWSAITPSRQNGSNSSGTNSMSALDANISRQPYSQLKDPDVEVVIYVGSPPTTLLVSRRNLSRSPFLVSNLKEDPTMGLYVMHPLLIDIAADNFKVVRAFLCDETLEDMGPLKLAEGYGVARKLGMQDLERLCWMQFSYCLTEKSSNIVINGIGELLKAGIEDRDIRRTLANHVADHFWDLIKEDMESLKTILKADKEFTRATLAELALLMAEQG